MNPSMSFREVSLFCMFHMNGNDYVKQSSRTARLLTNGRVFYVGQKELVRAFVW